MTLIARFMLWWSGRCRTVANLLAAWWVDYRPTIADTTAHHRQLTMYTHILPQLGDINLRGLIASDLDYLSTLSPNGQMEVYKILAQAFRWAVSHHWCRGKIVDLLQKPHYRPKEVRIFEVDELSRLLRHLEGRWLWLPVYLSSRTGLRRGEICGLQWSDIDLERGYLTVRRTISAVSSHDVYVRQPKTGKSRRRVDLDPDTIKVLKQRNQAAKTKWVCEAPRRSGGMPNPWHIVKLMHNACAAAGIPQHTFHELRHTHATLLLAEGVHPKVVAERLGHSKTAITLETYSHMTPTMQAPATAAMTHIFG